jgi:hypothetical protein
MANASGVVTASSLNVRREPSTDSKPPEGNVARGAAVEILEQRSGWYRIRSGSLSGWVFGDFVRLRDVQPVIGFLCVDPLLCETPLEPAAGERINPAAVTAAERRSVAETWNRYGGLLRALGSTIGVHPAAATAVLVTESNGKAFVDGRMVIRFENHIFHNQWGKLNPQLFANHFSFNAAKRWTEHKFRADPTAAWATFHGNQSNEWRVFEFARGLNESAAMRSISMGAPQIMGFNHATIGYDSVQEMFNRFQADERFQILGMFDFIKGASSTSPMIQALQRGDFEQFATRYNGPGQAQVYGSRIRSHTEALRSLLPGLA